MTSEREQAGWENPTTDIFDAVRMLVAAYRTHNLPTRTVNLFIPQYLLNRYGREAIKQAANDEARRWGFADAHVTVYES